MDNKELLKCGNDLKITVTKLNGEVIQDEECCTVVNLIMKNTGEIGTSFLGAYNMELVKLFEEVMANYMKTVKKEMKKQFKNPDNDDITVNKDEPLAEDKKWSEDATKKSANNIPSQEDSKESETPVNTANQSKLDKKKEKEAKKLQKQKEKQEKESKKTKKSKTEKKESSDKTPAVEQNKITPTVKPKKIAPIQPKVHDGENTKLK